MMHWFNGATGVLARPPRTHAPTSLEVEVNLVSFRKGR